MDQLKIEGDYIKLDQMLKAADLAQTGGHGKIIIQDGLVKVNGVVEYQRGKKLKQGDIVEVDGAKVKIVK